MANAMLRSGCYRVNAPEEGALLVVAWLVEHGHADHARTGLDHIGPHFSRLRFYPVPAPVPLTPSPLVHLQQVRETLEDIEDAHDSPAFATMRETIQVWHPLCDQIVQLFLETVDGPTPLLRTGADGKPLCDEHGRFQVEGGWPCQHYPEGWRARARAALERYRQTRAQHQRAGKPEGTKENFSRLRAYLQRCIDDPLALTGRDVAGVRTILAAIVTRRGTPNSQRCRELRAMQAHAVARPTPGELARPLVERLRKLPGHRGLDVIDAALTGPVTAAEAARFGLRPGQPIPENLLAMLYRCLDAPVEVLIEQGAIPSGEVLAIVIPQIMSHIGATSLVDPGLRLLHGAIYMAFRRSLRLLGLERQIQIHELPWVAAIDAHRSDPLPPREQARQTLEQVVVMALTAFPHLSLPNELVQELRALAESAGLQIPLLNEVTADIFMGDVTEKFLHATQKAADLLQGTLYETYYGISYEQVRHVDEQASRYGANTSRVLYEWCCELAGEMASMSRGSPARDGKIVEQEQILTTHNLAALFDALGLVERLGPILDDLARRCFAWICDRQQMEIKAWSPRLRMIKNTAHAWRQMIFHLSLRPRVAIESFLIWAEEHVARQRPEFQQRFRPAMAGLRLAAQGTSPSTSRGEARQFLGWTASQHWLLV